MTQSAGVSCKTAVLLPMSRETPAFRPGFGPAHPRLGSRWLLVVASVVLGLFGLGRRCLAAPDAAAPLPAPAAAGAITLEAETDHQFYRDGVGSEIYVLARLRTAAPAPAGDRADLAPVVPVRNIAFILDRSGSMDGERMQALQAAVAAALDALSARDVVSVVLFGSEVETLIEAQRSDQARDRFARLSPIEAAGGAALYDGLSQGAAQVRRFAGATTVNELILVTDGAATKGPRERDDFVRLVETFVREGTHVSTIGLGDEFDEDLLAALARSGGGRFHFADVPARLQDAILREVAPAQAVVATDAVVTIEYKPGFDGIRAHGARVATVGKSTVTWRLPQLAAGQELSLLASGELDSFRASGVQRDLIRVRLRWTDPATGESRELAQSLTVRFSPESRDLADGYNIRVYRAAVAAMIGEGMQDAIEQLDRGDFRRALRELRRVRSQARDANYTSADPEIAAMIAQLDAYIAEVQARGMNVLDRKVLRSGLFNQFETPAADEDAKR